MANYDWLYKVMDLKIHDLFIVAKNNHDIK